MTHYNRNRRTVREETKAELDFSESERVYGRSTYINRPSSYYQGSNEGDSDIRYSRNNGSKYRHDGGRSYVRGTSSYRTAGERAQQVRRGAPRIYLKEGLRETNMPTYEKHGATYYHRSNYGNDRTYQRGSNLSSTSYKKAHVPSEKYYVREIIREEPEKEEPETENVVVCCCGCIEVVDSIYCKGMKMYRCNCSSDEKEDKQKLTKTNTMSYRRQRDESFRDHQQQQQQYLMYRRRDQYSIDDESTDSETATETDHTYDEIPTRTKEMLTYEKPQTTDVYSRTDANVIRNAARPRSGEQRTQAYDIRQRNMHSAPPQKRHVGVQMTTKYIVQEQTPQKRLVRNVNTQTVKFQQEVIPPPSKPPLIKKEVVTHSYSPPSPPTQPPPPKPVYIGDKPKLQHYKTAIIDIGEQKAEEDVIVVPTDPPKTVIEVPKEPEPVPEPEIVWIHEYKPEPEVIIEPIYDPLPVEPWPLPVKEEPEKIIRPEQPVIKRVTLKPVKEKEPKKYIRPEQPVTKRVTLEPVKEEEPEKNIWPEQPVIKRATLKPVKEDEPEKDIRPEQPVIKRATLGPIKEEEPEKDIRPEQPVIKRATLGPIKEEEPEKDIRPEQPVIKRASLGPIKEKEPEKYIRPEQPVTKRATLEPVKEEEPEKDLSPEQTVIKCVTLGPIKEEKRRKEKAVIRVFAKGTTALFHLLPKPKGKSIMVRVGGGWMKVEHHRNHHVPLTVQEHHREANKDKYLYIKSKFVTDQKQVPVAYKKYREKVIKQGA